MRHALLALALCTGCAAAQETGVVLSSTPIIETITVSREVCTTTEEWVARPKTGAGAAAGAVLGGVLAHATARGRDRATTTMLGVMGGAVLGDQLERTTTEPRSVQRCVLQPELEQRIVGYEVVYRYAGRRHTARLPQAPGATIALTVSPTATLAPTPRPARTTDATTTTVIVQAPPRPSRMYREPYTPWRAHYSRPAPREMQYERWR
ncbi:glycine zipper 2TM domain-containing protein [Candidatus Symbiobacter mobilis]|uniref:Outer membrane lipoprotein-like protein n=1 Tax=Candidatus Symbiobacter mobilis CR TaxID=946483 RepID=U5N761_9BURK|nr:glycine zipper 2TM domain-containing protein [Candidatus Symbiobacter mobilis]AGX87232.1 outer membrane lipoprotein-like protein [Candidatus Symbiobacter mobilis CR]